MIRSAPDRSRRIDHCCGHVVEPRDGEVQHAPPESLHSGPDVRLRDGRGDVIEGPADDGFVSVADEAEGDMPLRPTRPPHAHELGPRQRLDLVEHRVGRPDRDEQALAQPISTRSSRRNRNRLSAEIVANCRI